MAYSDKVLDHFNNPRNVGSMDKADPNVGTGLVGAPECGDVMKLQIKVRKDILFECSSCFFSELESDTLVANEKDPLYGHCPNCPDGIMRKKEVEIIEEAKFKTFGCGSAIASSSLATEWIKGKTIEKASKIRNTDIVKELSLPPVKIHCSVLAEDAIKAAIADWKKKHGRT